MWAECGSIACPAPALHAATWAYAITSAWLAEVLLYAVGTLAVRHESPAFAATDHPLVCLRVCALRGVSERT